MAMKGYLHTMEAVVAALLLLSFVLFVDAPQSENTPEKHVTPSEQHVRDGDPAYVQSLFQQQYPLHTVAAAISSVHFRSGQLEDDTTIIFTNASVDRARLVLWLESANDLAVHFNGNQLLSQDTATGVIRQTLTPLAAPNNLSVQAASIDGTYHVLLSNTSATGTLVGKRRTYWYYNTRFSPVRAEVGLQ